MVAARAVRPVAGVEPTAEQSSRKQDPLGLGIAPLAVPTEADSALDNACDDGHRGEDVGPYEDSKGDDDEFSSTPLTEEPPALAAAADGVGEPATEPIISAAATTGRGQDGWTLEADLDPESGGLVVRWTAPRPLLEVKLGIGWALEDDDSQAVDHGEQYRTKSKKTTTLKSGPQPAGHMPFPASVTKSLVGRGAAIAACWDLDRFVAFPVVWSKPFRIVHNVATGKPAILPIDEPTSSTTTGNSTAALPPCEAASAPRGENNAALRGRRQCGVDKLNRSGVRRLLQMLKENTDPSLKVLRLKQYLDADANPYIIDTVLDALAGNTVVEALYIQNFEKGMTDPQLAHLGKAF